MIPIAAFAGIAALAWWVMDLVATGKPRTLERLDALRDARSGKTSRDATLAKRDKVTKAIENAAPALAKPLLPQNELEASKLKVQMANAGFRSESAGTIFLGAKFVGLLLGMAIGGGTLLSNGIDKQSLMIAVLIAGGCFYLPTVIVSLIRRSRQQGIFLGLPDALDLMVVCVEAGLGLDQAMRKVSEEMKKTHPIVAEEFGLANLQLQMGRPRNEVLHELGIRTGVADVRALAGVLIQADKFGSSIAHALRVQSDSMRTRRRQLAEEKAAKTAVKLIFPLVLFIFPGIFVVLVGPAGITMVNQMFPLMGGK
ncbi:MAG: type II secretion system F family protein [Pirellulales bacterium]|nr:type II secretion system F family protein [Pirellulales bacterium]